MADKTITEVARMGGKARAAAIANGDAPETRGRKAVPTPCERCGAVQPSARAAWMHCRKPRGR